MTETINPEVTLTLDDAVEEVLGLLTGQNLRYQAELDRYQAITRQLNRALRANALEQEWGYYSSTYEAGVAVAGSKTLDLPNTVRARIIGDDAVRLVDENGEPVRWAYILPRDALHKHAFPTNGVELWCAVTRTTITFSRPFDTSEDGLGVHVPVMREPVMFRLPEQPEDPNDPLIEVPDEIRNQVIDFDYPDVVISRAAYYVAMADPVMQPRAQTLEAEYKDLMYQAMERDSNFTESPFLNSVIVPLTGGTPMPGNTHRHPHANGW